MSKTRKVVKVFIASPGDLSDERYVVRDAVIEMNEILAKNLGYHIELMGWEDTPAGFGRPQHLINQDLDKCDLFIGVMWKRWGTPPDVNGAYTSGFEEEYERSIERRKQGNTPEISLFFKDVSDDLLNDPGDDLKKVLTFRKKIIDEKIILFQNFSDVKKLEKLIRSCVSNYIYSINRRERDSNQEEKEQERGLNIKDTKNENVKTPVVSSPLSVEGFEFLSGFVNRIKNNENTDDLTSYDIARFRLLSNTLSKTGNDVNKLGVHDINILYKNKNNINFGQFELYFLMKFGLYYINDENTPLWYWYSKLINKDLMNLAFISLSGDSETKVGVINFLKLVGYKLPNNNDVKRDWFLNSWFSDDSDVSVKNAALEYISANGIGEDFKVVKEEYDRNNYNTSRKALESMVLLLSIYGIPISAEELVIETQFDSLELYILQPVLDRFYSLPSDKLLIGLEHRSSEVRLAALKVLQKRNEIDDVLAIKLSKDSNASIRYESFMILIDNGTPLSISDAHRILIKPHQQNSLLGEKNSFDMAGNDCFDKFKTSSFRKLSESELNVEANKANVYDRIPYIVLSEKYFSKYQEDLRMNIDDHFNSYFDDKIKELSSIHAGDHIKKMINLKGFICKEFTRKGLDILCTKKKVEDINRIRENLKTRYVGVSHLDVKYFEKHGGWSDIELLASSDLNNISSLLIGKKDVSYTNCVAKFAYKIGRNSISELLMLNISPSILTEILSICSDSTIKDISDEVIFQLLNNDNPNVRKRMSIVAIRALSIKKIKYLLDEYLSGDEYRYYNVIHWLDLGSCMPKSLSKRIIKNVV